ncbi:RNA-directed DNA polymerase, eukaryota, reverse transcriptase zinc-binding domain protein [Tanacetum coccineum]
MNKSGGIEKANAINVSESVAKKNVNTKNMFDVLINESDNADISAWKDCKIYVDVAYDMGVPVFNEVFNGWSEDMVKYYREEWRKKVNHNVTPEEKLESKIKELNIKTVQRYFNVALKVEDCSNCFSVIDKDMEPFRRFLESLDLEDIYSTGMFYTWYQKRNNPDNGILKKLDRVLGNSSFLSLFGNCYENFLPFVTSDHCPATLVYPEVKDQKPNSFRFLNFLADKENFLPTVRNNWNIEVKGSEDTIFAIDDVESLFIWKLDSQCALNMVRAVVDSKIKEAMFSIDDKAVGLDGFTSKILKSAWSVVGSDVCSAVKEFFSSGKILGEFNANLISLIPKLQTPLKVTVYRPIACCNVVYKCNSKVITNRLKEGLSEIIDSNQSPFILGRQVSDNILLSQEFMRGYSWKYGMDRCAFKIDIQKAYGELEFFKNCSSAFWFSQFYDSMDNAWSFKWHSKGLLSKLISYSFLKEQGLDLNAKVADLIGDNGWLWPLEWYGRFGTVINAPVLDLIHDCEDKAIWFNKKNKECIPRHAFILLMVVRGRLKMQDRKSSCDFSKEIWNKLKVMSRLDDLADTWAEVVSVYYIWQERNIRLFQKEARYGVRSVLDGLLLVLHSNGLMCSKVDQCLDINSGSIGFVSTLVNLDMGHNKDSSLGFWECDTIYIIEKGLNVDWFSFWYSGLMLSVGSLASAWNKDSVYYQGSGLIDSMGALVSNSCSLGICSALDIASVKWKRYVTLVHQPKKLHDVDYNQLYDYLKHNQEEIGGNQNGLIVVPGIDNQNGNGNVVAERAEGNGNENNYNQIRCYNFQGVGHYARNCIVMPRRMDAAYLQTQLLIAQKEEARI